MHAMTKSGMLAGAAALLVAVSCAGSAPPARPVPSIGPLDLATRIQDGQAPLLLDVRTAGEFAAGHIPGALNIPHTELESRIGEIAAYRSVELVLYCEDGNRSQRAAAVLGERGFERLLRLEGDFAAWRADGRPTAP